MLMNTSTNACMHEFEAIYIYSIKSIIPRNAFLLTRWIFRPLVISLVQEKEIENIHAIVEVGKVQPLEVSVSE